MGFRFSLRSKEAAASPNPWVLYINNTLGRVIITNDAEKGKPWGDGWQCNRLRLEPTSKAVEALEKSGYHVSVLQFDR